MDKETTLRFPIEVDPQNIDALISRIGDLIESASNIKGAFDEGASGIDKFIAAGVGVDAAIQVVKGGFGVISDLKKKAEKEQEEYYESIAESAKKASAVVEAEYKKIVAAHDSGTSAAKIYQGALERIAELKLSADLKDIDQQIAEVERDENLDPKEKAAKVAGLQGDRASLQSRGEGRAFFDEIERKKDAAEAAAKKLEIAEEERDKALAEPLVLRDVIRQSEDGLKNFDEIFGAPLSGDLKENNEANIAEIEKKSDQKIEAAREAAKRAANELEGIESAIPAFRRNQREGRETAEQKIRHGLEDRNQSEDDKQVSIHEFQDDLDRRTEEKVHKENLRDREREEKKQASDFQRERREVGGGIGRLARALPAGTTRRKNLEVLSDDIRADDHDTAGELDRAGEVIERAFLSMSAANKAAATKLLKRMENLEGQLSTLRETPAP